MIAIKYSGRTIVSYETFCDKFDKRVEQWLQHQYVGKAGNHITMDNDAYHFFEMLKQEGIKKIAYMKADNLISFIELIEQRYPQLITDRRAKSNNPKAATSTLYKCIKKAFSNYGYDSSTFPGNDLMTDLDLTVCPYCNRNFVKHIVVRKNNKEQNVAVKGELDHFFRDPFIRIWLSLGKIWCHHAPHVMVAAENFILTQKPQVW